MFLLNIHCVQITQIIPFGYNLLIYKFEHKHDNLLQIEWAQLDKLFITAPSMTATPHNITHSCCLFTTPHKLLSTQRNISNLTGKNNAPTPKQHPGVVLACKEADFSYIFTLHYACLYILYSRLTLSLGLWRRRSRFCWLCQPARTHPFLGASAALVRSLMWCAGVR